MGYPQFNLATLQLVAPSSNMTLQEYKDAYGIDLTKTDIHAFKLVLFGGEKYAIDQIKDVEGGYEIYFNGHILSITNIVQTSNEVYDVANAKPIYIHPLSLVGGPDSSARITSLIFNNSPTKIDSPSAFADYIQALYTLTGADVRILAAGTYIDSDEDVIVTTYFGRTSSYYFIAGAKVNGEPKTNTYSYADFVALFTTIYDGVNKIN